MLDNSRDNIGFIESYNRKGFIMVFGFIKCVKGKIFI